MPAFVKFDGVEGEVRRFVEENQNDLSDVSLALFDAATSLPEADLFDFKFVQFANKASENANENAIHKFDFLKLKFDVKAELVEEPRDPEVIADDLERMLAEYDLSVQLVQQGSGGYFIKLGNFSNKALDPLPEPQEPQLTDIVDDILG